MRKILLLMAVATASLTYAYAGPTLCLTNAFGEQTTLTVTGHTGTTFWVSGEIDYTIFGGLVWPCAGKFDLKTRTLTYTATNPEPDNCTYWATTVDFYYTVSGVYLSGGFSNDCGNYGSLDAAVAKGACPFSTVKLKPGEYGTSGSTKLLRSKSPLPKGESLEEILKINTISVTPNPVSKIANINVTLAASSKITINVYNKEGALVYTVVNGVASAGKHTYTWNLQTRNGVAKTNYYIVKLITKDDEQSAQILVTR